MVGLGLLRCVVDPVAAAPLPSGATARADQPLDHVADDAASRPLSGREFPEGRKSKHGDLREAAAKI